MTRAHLTCFVLAPLIFALGCQLPNPAFDPDVGAEGSDGGTGDGSEASSAEGTTTQTSGTEDPTGDGDGDGDGDATTEDTGMEAPSEEGPVLDLPPDTCNVPTRAGLLPRFGAPEQFEGQVCPGELDTWVKVYDQAGGDWRVGMCPDGCGTCSGNVLYTVGAQALKLATLMPPPMLEPNSPWIGCFYVEAAPLVFDDGGACTYGSLSIHTDEGPLSPLLFNANRDSWDLTPSAAEQLSDWHPQILDDQMAQQCPCEDLDVDCCPGQNVVAKKFDLGNGQYVYPDQEAVVFLGGNTSFEFFGIQAQSGLVCEPNPETSWALLAQQ